MFRKAYHADVLSVSTSALFTRFLGDSDFAVFDVEKDCLSSPDFPLLKQIKTAAASSSLLLSTAEPLATSLRNPFTSLEMQSRGLRMVRCFLMGARGRLSDPVGGSVADCIVCFALVALERERRPEPKASEKMNNHVHA